MIGPIGLVRILIFPQLHIRSERKSVIILYTIGIPTMCFVYQRSEQKRRVLPLALADKAQTAADDRVLRPVLRKSYTSRTFDSGESLKDPDEIISDPIALQKKKKSVSFSVVEIRRYPITLGDNPSCSNGPPVQIDWAYTELPPVPLNTYALYHPPGDNEQSWRGSSVPTMSAEVRWVILHNEAGFSMREIAVAVLEVGRTSRKRKESMSIITAERFRKVWTKTGEKVAMQLSMCAHPQEPRVYS